MGNPTDQPANRPETEHGDTPQRAALGVAEFIDRYGERWELQGRADLGVFIAVARPTPTASRIIAARTIQELAAKVAAAEAEQ